ncbi:hypothetical protein SDJN02_18720, partial [Cucurbita argyrosperma subsp. argyrosperma]
MALSFNMHNPGAFAFGLLVHGSNRVKLPNVPGFIFGIAQMILYIIYNKQEIAEEMTAAAAAANAAATNSDKEKQDSVEAVEVIITEVNNEDKDKNLEVNGLIRNPNHV